MKIRQITRDKDDYIDMLLMADPQKDMIERYLYQSEMFVLVNGGDDRISGTQRFRKFPYGGELLCGP